MASLAVASSVNVAASASSLIGTRVTGASSRNGPVSVRMSPARCLAKSDTKSDEVVQRRAMVTGLAAVLATVATGYAPGEPGEPKKGSPQAKKKYASVCVANPTASYCHG